MIYKCYLFQNGWYIKIEDQRMHEEMEQIGGSRELSRCRVRNRENRERSLRLADWKYRSPSAARILREYKLRIRASQSFIRKERENGGI